MIRQGLKNTMKTAFSKMFYKANAFDKVLEYLRNNFEYFFYNYLYNTIEYLIDKLKEHFPENNLLSYLEIRLNRSTGKIKEAIRLLNNIKEKDYRLLLEE